MKDYKWYGHFNADDSFTITEPETPRHWYNYFFNDEYVMFTSQTGFGEGLAQDDMGRRILLVSNRNVFLSEGESFWSLFGLPLGYGLYGLRLPAWQWIFYHRSFIPWHRERGAPICPKRGQTRNLERNAYQQRGTGAHAPTCHLCENGA